MAILSAMVTFACTVIGFIACGRTPRPPRQVTISRLGVAFGGLVVNVGLSVAFFGRLDPGIAGVLASGAALAGHTLATLAGAAVFRLAAALCATESRLDALSIGRGDWLARPLVAAAAAGSLSAFIGIVFLEACTLPAKRCTLTDPNSFSTLFIILLRTAPSLMLIVTARDSRLCPPMPARALRTALVVETCTIFFFVIQFILSIFISNVQRASQAQLYLVLIQAAAQILESTILSIMLCGMPGLTSIRILKDFRAAAALPAPDSVIELGVA